MEKLRLSLALDEYDHTRDVISGRVPVEGVELITMSLQIEEIFYRNTLYHEWDVSELSMGKYVALRSQGDETFTAIPVFVSRQFRLSMIYVREGGGISRPEQLAGKRIGLPEWAQTATVYSRGYLAHTARVPLESIDWVQAGVHQTGRVEKVKLNLPPGLKLRRVSDRTLDDLLLAGELDAVLSARAPRSLGKGIVRLFPDYRPVEEEYYRNTGIYPIMHVIVVRTEVLRQHPWVAMNLMRAFEEAKRRSYARLDEIGVSAVPVAWLADYIGQMKSLFGDDFFPYGVDKNRVTLDAFLQFAHEQGVCHRRLQVEELFPKQVLTSFKV
ncbi:MAG TPA: 4,5-dihydroxyphthalate decarboxylase [Burkholderiales bacterium]|nr:4,5-dihydroxyphthalate decarboxylase [Burkholderiales bacterium]